MTKPMHVVIEGEMSVFTAAALREKLLHALAQRAEVEVDLDRVTEIDSAGLQLMLAARKEAAALGRQLRFTEGSAAVREILDLCGMREEGGTP